MGVLLAVFVNEWSTASLEELISASYMVFILKKKKIQQVSLLLYSKLTEWESKRKEQSGVWWWKLVLS